MEWMTVNCDSSAFVFFWMDMEVEDTGGKHMGSRVHI